MISIVIPSYNQADYLPEAIESALAQNNQFKDIIVIDDGSTDNSLEIARKYEKENEAGVFKRKIITVISQVNKGLASARNTGIMNAKNDWIFFLDADDKLTDNALVRIIQTINYNPDADIISPSFRTFGTSNEEVILMSDPKLEDFRTGNRIPTFSAIRKEKLLEVGGYNPKMVEGYEDLALWCDLLSRGAKIKTLQEPLVWYRTKDKSMWKDITPEIHKKLLAQINKDVPKAQLNF